jgi:hypothetical protein
MYFDKVNRNQSKFMKNLKFLIFSIFLENCYFVGFFMRKKLYLGAEMINFDSKTRFGKNIKFYYEVNNKMT